MAKKISVLLGVLLMLAALFFLSYKMTEKIRSDKFSADEPSSSEAGTELPPETSEAASEASETSIPAEEIPDETLPEQTVINMPADSTWCLVLLNKFYRMNDNYEPPVELVFEDSGVWLDERVAEKYREMYAAALNDGVTLTPAAGYVSLERQERKFTKLVDQYVAGGMSEEEAKGKASFTVLPAGCSESNYGLAVDIGWLAADFAQSPAYAWLCRHAAEYGFIERYTKDNSDYTHFNAQPWHWRYVGADAAKAMNEQGLSLEEYVGKVN